MTNDPAAGLPGPAQTRPGNALSSQPASPEREFEKRSYLRDYAAMMDATPHPSLLIDHSWNVTAANRGYETLFREAGPHPTAMPGQNFLRFVLFHPDAADVLREHETSWCLPLLAQFSAALETHAQDATLQDIRRHIADDALMNAAYQQGLPRWMRLVGARALDHDGAVRPLHHPDPPWGRTTCRVVTETPSTLQSLGLTRMTLVLHAQSTAPSVPQQREAPSARPHGTTGRRPAAPHLRVVPAGP
ncbi:hypothetical protein ACFQVC_20160 [Streptomyces monticola]|uniref:MmyB-like transcription regulator ligand binding domain-containing protein n=1 Tax=Streptomyces monticola TaxID=2666263 RepID=A0ABW2JM37_9ACTN